MHGNRINFIILIITPFVFFVSCQQPELRNQIQLESWQFRQDTSQSWYNARIPGCVHTDLLAIGLIPDPFFGDNEQPLQWIGNSNWTYRTTFLSDGILENDHVDLTFEGLDTYADVFLNDSLVLKADNMFRQWRVGVKDLLIKGENELRVKFTPPERVEQEKAAELPYKLPDSRGFTRKAPYQYGWDWGPKFVTQGLWKPVYLQGWNDVRILNLHVFTREIKKDQAILTVEAEIQSETEQKAGINFTIGDDEYSYKAELKRGSNLFKKEIEVREPQLWWPNGMGDHPLYTMDFHVKAGQSNASLSTRFGIRQIELVRDKDSVGGSFYFKINGVPFFAKGANYIPQDNFPARVPDEKYRQTIQNAVDANMNMLRVWGGGIYEKDIFYDLCDQNGILVWQDFMFACNMYPGDTAFLNNVQKEADYQVKRLRNHPSLAVWCGNNEISEGWHNWGWQKSLGYSKADSLELWNNYQKIFENILPEAVQNYNPEVAYHPSSPKIGWGHEEALLEGDMHYWGVWWGAEPFGVYRKKVGRFMSEYGFQGFPDPRTLDSCLKPEDKNLHSAALLNHQKHPRGMELIRIYMERDFPVPHDFLEYNYVSQLVQGYGISMAIEAQRRAMPRCMGSLYWQLNDCWPVISWSSIDYYNRWKALHFHARAAYRDVLISFEENENEVLVYLISDRQQDFQAALDLRIIDFEGHISWEETHQVKIHKTSSMPVKSIDIAGVSKEDQVLVGTLYAGDTMVAQQLFYFVSPKNLNLQQAEPSCQIKPVKNGYKIEISAGRLLKNIGLFIPHEGHFSDNFFDLLPGESKTVLFECDSVSGDPGLKILTLNDLLN